MSVTAPYFALAREGLWHNNPGLVQLLGLCPLAAVSTTAIYGLALGIATMGILIVSNSLIFALRGFIPTQVRIPAYVLVIATGVSAADLLMQAYSPVLYQHLGLFIPLIATDCVILARAELSAGQANIGRAAFDALAMGAGFMLVL